jgi:cell fate (sporulation/competence/biofilm development) regulator YlbF (YheA/YmcA/DUF963 family)
MTNIQAELNKLVESFSALEEFTTLKDAVAQVREDEEAKTYFTNFRDIQIKLQQKQIAGEEISEDEITFVQKAATLAQSNPKIITMLEAEMKLSDIIEEVNRDLFKPIQDLYEGL